MKRILRVSLGWLGRRLRKYFLAGIFVVVPIGITVLILVWMFEWVDNILQPIIKGIVGHTIPGLGFGIMVILIYLAGFIVSNVLGRRAVRYGESLLTRAPIPMVPQLYAGIKQIMESFSEPRKGGFMQVVLVEFPRKGMSTIGFITNELSDKAGKKLFNIFIPTSPNPTSGFLQIARESEITRTDISVDDALKMVVSAGRMSLEEVTEKLSLKN